jgi:hypothetical protein
MVWLPGGMVPSPTMCPSSSSKFASSIRVGIQRGDNRLSVGMKSQTHAFHFRSPFKKIPTNALLESFLLLLATGNGHCILLCATNVATTTLLHSRLSVELIPRAGQNN